MNVRFIYSFYLVIGYLFDFIYGYILKLNCVNLYNKVDFGKKFFDFDSLLMRMSLLKGIRKKEDFVLMNKLEIVIFYW